jgi:hypothetical protein
LWFEVAAGASLIIYNLLTVYTFSMAKVIPFNVHIIFDSFAALAFIVPPFILGFTGIVQIHYLVMGVGVLAVYYSQVKLSFKR